MTDEHKKKLQEGRVRSKAGLPKEPKPVKTTIKKTKVMSEDHKRKLIEGRAKAKLEGRVRKARTVKEPNQTKIIVHLTGKEKDSYDFFNPIRKAYRAVGNYKDYPKLLKEISNPIFCNDIMKIQECIRLRCEVAKC